MSASSAAPAKPAAPVGAISEGDSKYQIDPDACIECGACESDCPVGAPHMG